MRRFGTDDKSDTSGGAGRDLTFKKYGRTFNKLKMDGLCAVLWRIIFSPKHFRGTQNSIKVEVSQRRMC